MDFERFFESIYELTDLWCTGVRVGEYMAFLTALLDSVCDASFGKNAGGSSFALAGHLVVY